MTTMQQQVPVMHWSLQLQRQRVTSTLQRRVIVVVVRPPREVAVAMGWRDSAVAVAGAMAGEVAVAAVVVVEAVAVVDEEEVLEPRHSIRTVMVLHRPQHVHSAASYAVVQHSVVDHGTKFLLSYTAYTTRRRRLYPSPNDPSARFKKDTTKGKINNANRSTNVY
jgi:hypothetical protein